ncbi:nitroreductase family protein [uncultured Clostridium sp.]|uniref:nitroreductase family protein n=1 Tax=uncultured Clostridium sp. TaxID=59620 RepID=UPI002621973F|nr:nitroreductase family protein [uncultured Clostridium sp.]
MENHIIRVDKNLCIGCALCKNDCPVNNIKIENKKAVIKSQDCIKCGHCEAICPKNAVTLTEFNEETIDIKEQSTLDSKELLMALKSRRTIRKFKDEEIHSEIIEEIIQAGRFTPTAKNAQGVSFIVLDKDKEIYEKIAVKFFRRFQKVAKYFDKSAREVIIDDNFFFKKAPIIILVIDKDKISASLAASNMALMAESHGLGVLYSGFFSEVAKHSRKIKKLLGLKGGREVVATLVIGYPNVKYRRTAQRKKAVVKYL